MNNKTKKKLWSAQEKVYLGIGYKLGASLKIISIVLNRTEGAINKALDRQGVRQHGANKRGRKSYAERSVLVTAQTFRNRIAVYDDQAKHHQNQMAINSSFARSQECDTSGLYPNPFIRFPKRQTQPLTPWSDLDYIITYLKNKGHIIQRCRGNLKILGGVKIEFYLNGIPMSAAQLLVRANRLRLEQGLEPFYVESITEH